jgi:hypothetical protein
MTERTAIVPPAGNALKVHDSEGTACQRANLIRVGAVQDVDNGGDARDGFAAVDGIGRE